MCATAGSRVSCHISGDQKPISRSWLWPPALLRQGSCLCSCVACSPLAALPSSGQVFCLCLPSCLWNAGIAHACYPTQVDLFACLLASLVGSGLQTRVLSLCSRQQAFLPTKSSSWPSDCFCDDFISFSFNFCLDKEERHLPVVRSTASRCFSFTHRPRLWLLPHFSPVENDPLCPSEQRVDKWHLMSLPAPIHLDGRFQTTTLCLIFCTPGAFFSDYFKAPLIFVPPSRGPQNVYSVIW